MTEHFRLWKEEADRLEIPDSIQKAAIFMTAPEIQFREGATIEFARRLCPTLPDLPKEHEGNFYTDDIAGALLELTQKMDPDFQVRTIQYRNLASFPSFPTLSGEVLPRFDRDRMTLGACARIAHALYQSIGDAIHDDLEAAHSDGYKFVSAYYAVDSRSTSILFQNGLYIRPPHLRWLSSTISHDPDEVRAMDLMYKVFVQFRGGADENSVLLLDLFFDRLWFLESGARNEEVSEADISEFRWICIERAYRFVRIPQISEFLPTVRPSIVKQGFPTLPNRYSRSELLKDMDEILSSYWGYDLSQATTDLYLGEIMDLRSSIIATAIVLTALNPDWATSAMSS